MSIQSLLGTPFVQPPRAGPDYDFDAQFEAARAKGLNQKILLLEPIFPSERIWGRFKAGGGFVPPIGLMTIFSFIKELGYDVEFCDSRANGLTFEGLRRKLADGRYDIVGIPAFTNTVADSYRSAKAVKEVLPDAKVVLGGVHVTLLPERSLEECPDADYIVVGEGEFTFAELIRHVVSKPDELPENILGLCYRDRSGKIVKTADRPLIPDPDRLPHPHYADIQMDLYVPHPTQYKRLPNFPVFTQRGCPYKCTFCQASVTMGKKPRVKSPKKILDEIGILREVWGAKGVYFQDSAFTIRKKWVYDLCAEIKARGWRFEWACNARVDNVDRELLSAMKEAGCWMIAYGIESGNQSTLDLLKKGITIEQQRRAVYETQRAGIQVLGNYLLCLPREDEAMVMNTIDYSIELGAEMSLFWLPIPYPRTELVDACLEDGGFDPYASWDNYGAMEFRKLVYVNKRFTQEQMIDFQRLAFRKYYTQPKIYWKNLKTIRSWVDVVRYYKAAKAVIGGAS